MTSLKPMRLRSIAMKSQSLIITLGIQGQVQKTQHIKSQKLYQSPAILGQKLQLSQAILGQKLQPSQAILGQKLQPSQAILGQIPLLSILSQGVITRPDQAQAPHGLQQSPEIQTAIQSLALPGALVLPAGLVQQAKRVLQADPGQQAEQVRQADPVQEVVAQ